MIDPTSAGGITESREITVRAYLHARYADRPTTGIEVRNGRILPPEAPGLGAQFRSEIFERSDVKVTTSRLGD